VSRDFAKSCETPMIVLPDDIVAHPLQPPSTSPRWRRMPKSPFYPWKEPPELKARTVSRARTFLKRHVPA